MFTAQTTGEFWTIARTAMAKVATITLFLPLAWGQGTSSTPPVITYVLGPYVVPPPFITAEIKVNNPGNMPADVNCGDIHSQFGLQGIPVGTIGAHLSAALLFTVPQGSTEFWCTTTQPIIPNVYISTQTILPSSQSCAFLGLIPQNLVNGAVPAPLTTAPLAFTVSVGAVRPAGNITYVTQNPFNKIMGATVFITSDGGVTTSHPIQPVAPGEIVTSTFPVTDQDVAVSVTTTLPTPFQNVTTGEGIQFMMRDFHLIAPVPDIGLSSFILPGFPDSCAYQ